MWSIKLYKCLQGSQVSSISSFIVSLYYIKAGVWYLIAFQYSVYNGNCGCFLDWTKNSGRNYGVRKKICTKQIYSGTIDNLIYRVRTKPRNLRLDSFSVFLFSVLFPFLQSPNLLLHHHNKFQTVFDSVACFCTFNISIN